MQQGISLRIFSFLILVLFSVDSIAGVTPVAVPSNETTPVTNTTSSQGASHETSPYLALAVILPVAVGLIVTACGVGYLSGYCQDRCAKGYEELPSR